MEKIIKLKYKGSRVDRGNMDSYQVAASILAFSDFLGILTRESYGNKAVLSTTIQGFEKGSFDIIFWLNVGMVTHNLVSPYLSDLKDLTTLMKDVIGFYKFLRGKPPQKTIRKENKIEVTNNYGQILYINDSVINVISDPKSGKSVENFIKKPLSDEDLDSVEILPQHDESVAISSDEAPSFVEVDINSPLNEANIEMTLLIVSPVFNEGNKWKFYDGNSNFFAEISDEAFLYRVNTGKERFGKGDQIKAIVSIKQVGGFNNLKQERTIVKVIAHKEALVQEDLFA